MNAKVLKTEKDYTAAIKRLEFLTDKGENEQLIIDEDDEIEHLSLLISNYEQKHFPIGKPNPIEYIRYILENKNLKQQDLVNIMGVSKGTFSNILNYRKKLSLNMIRALHKSLGIPYDILMEDYQLKIEGR